MKDQEEIQISFALTSVGKRDIGNETTEISSLGYFERRRSKNSFCHEKLIPEI